MSGMITARYNRNHLCSKSQLTSKYSSLELKSFEGMKQKKSGYQLCSPTFSPIRTAVWSVSLPLPLLMFLGAESSAIALEHMALGAPLQVKPEKAHV